MGTGRAPAKPAKGVRRTRMGLLRVLRVAWAGPFGIPASGERQAPEPGRVTVEVVRVAVAADPRHLPLVGVLPEAPGRPRAGQRGLPRAVGGDPGRAVEVPPRV